MAIFRMAKNKKGSKMKYQKNKWSLGPFWKTTFQNMRRVEERIESRDCIKNRISTLQPGRCQHRLSGEISRSYMEVNIRPYVLADIVKRDRYRDISGLFQFWINTLLNWWQTRSKNEKVNQKIDTECRKIYGWLFLALFLSGHVEII